MKAIYQEESGKLSVYDNCTKIFQESGIFQSVAFVVDAAFGEIVEFDAENQSVYFHDCRGQINQVKVRIQ